MHWSEAKKGEVNKTLWPYIQRLANEYQATRLYNLEDFASMVNDNDPVGLFPSRVQPPSVLADRSSQNIFTRSLVDTVTQQICASRPRPLFSSTGGSWADKERKETLQLFADGLFDQLGVYELTTAAFREAATLGQGCLKVTIRNKKPRIERVSIAALIVDPRQSSGVSTNELFQRIEITKRELKRLVPKKAKEIESLGGADCLSGTTRVEDSVVVYEAWLLPYDDETPGRHLLIANGLDLLDDPWEQEDFPFAFIRWQPLDNDWYGKGIPSQVWQLQSRVNQILTRICRNIDLFGNPKLLLPKASDIAPEMIRSAIGDVLKFSGMAAPQLFNPPVMASDNYRMLDWLIDQMYKTTGISTQASFAQKAPGIESGKAIIEVSDLQSGRLATVSQAYENFILNLTKKLIASVSDITRKQGDLVTTVVTKGFVKTINWKSIDSNDSDFNIQLQGANYNARIPAAITDRIEQLANMGILRRDQVLRLYESRDLESVLEDENAFDSIYRKQINMIMEQGIYIGPDPLDKFDIAKPLYWAAYMRAKQDDVPEEKLQMFRDYLEDSDIIQQELAQKQAAANPQAAPETPQPMAAQAA